LETRKSFFDYNSVIFTLKDYWSNIYIYKHDPWKLLVPNFVDPMSEMSTVCNKIN